MAHPRYFNVISYIFSPRLVQGSDRWDIYLLIIVLNTIKLSVVRYLLKITLICVIILSFKTALINNLAIPFKRELVL